MGELNFDEFIDRVKDFELIEICKECHNAIIDSTKLLARRRRGRLKKIYYEENNKLESYITQLKEFSFFLIYSTPSGTSNKCPASYFPVVRNMVIKGVLKESVFDFFE